MTDILSSEPALSIDPPAPRAPGKVHAILLICILVFAAAVRLHGITKEAVWFDECATVEVVRAPWNGVLKAIARSENTPPGYYLFLKAWCDFAGTGPLAIRLPSALAGVASIWMLYRFCAYLIGSTEGLIAAALMAASRYHIWYSQEARTYIFMVLLAIWSCDEFVRMLDQPSRWQRELRYWLSVVLLLYSHLFAAIVVAAQVIHYLARKLFGPRPALHAAKFAQLQFAAWVMFAMWLPVLKHWYEMRFEGFSDVSVSLQDITTSYWIYLCNENRPVMLIAVALFVIGAARRDVWRSLPMLLSLALLPVLVPVIASILTHPLYVSRYGIIAMTGLYILIACGIARFPRVARPVVVIGLAVPMMLAPNPSSKGPFKAVGAYLHQWAQGGDSVWVNCRADLAPVRYHTERSDVKFRGFWGKQIPMGVPLPQLKMRVWFVIADPLPEQSGVVSINYGHWRVVSQKAFDGVTVFELADGATTAEETYPDDVRLNAKPPTTDRTPPPR